MNSNLMDEKEYANISLLQYMPLFFNGFVVENTSRCNAKCDICYQASSSKGSEYFGLAKLDKKIIIRCIRVAAELDNIGSRFHLAGGESFLYPDECLIFFREARNTGFEDITATTNGFWGKSQKKSRDLAEKMREAGLNGIEISWDFWHKQFIDAKTISNCIESCFNSEININLRILTTKSHSIEEAILSLPPETLEFVSRITSGPVFPSGRAETMLDPNEFFNSNIKLNGGCHRVLNLAINSVGNVYPCCAGLDMTSNIIFGNVNNENLELIAQRINNDPLIRRLVFTGIHSFIPILQTAGYEIQNINNNSCKLCRMIFSDYKYSQVIRNYFETRKREALIRLVNKLEENL